MKSQKNYLKKYIYDRPHSNFAKLYKSGIFKITTTKDDGELHPWSTWPSLHRGVPNFVHNIRYLNQDLKFANQKFPPFWVTLASAGIDVGIFGSLQSFPPIYGKKITNSISRIHLHQVQKHFQKK